LHVALWEPEIPPNTGNVARLCAATGTRLHLIGRLGFRLDDRSLRRAGIDYWHAVDVVTHVTFADFELALHGELGAKVVGSARPTPLAPLPEGRGEPDEDASLRSASEEALSAPSSAARRLSPLPSGRGAGGVGRTTDASTPEALPLPLWCIETPAAVPYTRAEFADGDCLLFGSESSGLPPSLRERFAERTVGVPMPTGAVRSLNLATTVGIVLYDALRRLHGW
jgi:tRNA (cytidine/uridine-2'-O-)-methyltransferase